MFKWAWCFFAMQFFGRYLQGEPFSRDFFQSGSNKAKKSQAGPNKANLSHFMRQHHHHVQVSVMLLCHAVFLAATYRGSHFLESSFNLGQTGPRWGKLRQVSLSWAILWDNIIIMFNCAWCFFAMQFFGRNLQWEPFSTNFIQSGSNRAKKSQAGPNKANLSHFMYNIIIMFKWVWCFGESA